MIRILYHRRKCIGCNACVEAAPERWRVSKRDGRCNLIGGVENKGVFKAVVNMDEYDKNMQAAVNCPQNIIKVEEVN